MFAFSQPSKISTYLTLKKSLLDPDASVPYWISRCLAKSSADSIGVSMRSTVRNAAKLAVYDEIMISVKNHHALPTIRPDRDLIGKNNMNTFLSEVTSASAKFSTTRLPIYFCADRRFIAAVCD